MTGHNSNTSPTINYRRDVSGHCHHWLLEPLLPSSPPSAPFTQYSSLLDLTFPENNFIVFIYEIVVYLVVLSVIVWSFSLWIDLQETLLRYMALSYKNIFLNLSLISVYGAVVAEWPNCWLVAVTLRGWRESHHDVRTGHPVPNFTTFLPNLSSLWIVLSHETNTQLIKIVHLALRVTSKSPIWKSCLANHKMERSTFSPIEVLKPVFHH